MKETVMKTDKDIELLVEKFLDGATTNAEERRLYDYFSGSRVARRLEKYVPMFRWYAGGMAEPLPAGSNGAGGRARLVGLRMRVAVCAAAAVLIVAGAAAGFRHYRQTERLYATYEGSYIVRGGKKITDLKAILPELRRIERDAEALACRSRKIGRMSPKQIFRMMDEQNRTEHNGPTI